MQIQLNIVQQTFGVNSELSVPDFNYTIDLEEVPEIPGFPEIADVPEYIENQTEFPKNIDLA